MLAELLRSVGEGTDEGDGIAELVVTALGTNKRHYLCWKTPSGEYRQHGHDLPEALDQWLFPPDGSTRDFETLQVLLSSDGGFWASDKNGQIGSKDAPPRALRRTVTTNEKPAYSGHVRRWSSTAELANPLKRRSSTWSSPGQRGGLSPLITSSTQNEHRKSQIIAQSPVRSPMVVEQKDLTRSRARSSTLGDGRSTEWLPPQPAGIIPVTTPEVKESRVDCCCACHACQKPSPLRQTHAVASRPTYVDTGIQTDDLSARGLAQDGGEVGGRMSAPPAFFQTTLGVTEYSGSILQYEPALPPTSNPVAMGRMYAYFHGGSYVLGDALQPL